MVKKHILCALIVFCSLGACNSEHSTTKANQQTYIKAIYSLPLTLNPIQMNDTSSVLVSNLIYDGLLSFSPELQFQGAIAESWAPENNGRSYVFKIRSNAKFHDGTQITAADVVRSLTRAVSKDSTVYKYCDCIVGADEFHQGTASSVVGLKTESYDKVRIDLKYPFPPFLSVLAGATAKILPSAADTDPNFFKKPNGSGAFRYSEIKRGKSEELILTRFENYYGSKPKIQTLVLRALSEKEAQEQASQGKVDDLANYPLAGTEAVFKSGMDADSPLAATWIIGFNTRIAPLNDLKVRKAFKNAVDTEGFSVVAPI